ncbi:toll/interleukin-1 receptor domain-containing adapter protein [Takifugu flavidus]|uniref:toll/interleukin-1 receptor domain-containing adapter protein n=1 Tax=Takifugu flavidus TaxID=433684 RepID=UPI0025446BD8|nr:toll/interleukin-1 receptor domain-containing adapter protein [Takifugu flavidus]
MRQRKSYKLIGLSNLTEGLIRHDENNMYGWFQKILNFRVSFSAHDQHVGKEAKQSSGSSSFCPLSSSWTPTVPQAVVGSALSCARKYDVFVCHSSVDSDSEEAARLVSFLEAPPRSFRCFLQERDECPGAAISTELCQAVQDSHIWVLLITPNFLKDAWCHYIMHQALAEGAMFNRIIPLVLNLSDSQYPQELKFFCYIDLSDNLDRGYSRLSNTVHLYLKDWAQKEKSSGLMSNEPKTSC